MTNRTTKFTIYPLILAVLLSLGSTACSDILDAKPQQSLLVPRNISDFQSLMDNIEVMNRFGPGLIFISADDFFTNQNGWDRLYFIEQNTYAWKEDIYENNPNIADWSSPYQTILYANIVLEGIDELQELAGNEGDIVRARALFYRAYAYFHLAQAFCDAYDPNTANDESGLPLQLTSDVNAPAQWATLEEVYEYIEQDLSDAMEHLEDKSIGVRPSKAACYALFSRIELIRGDYSEARSWTSAALSISDDLLDYNALSDSSARPFPLSYLEDNPEVVFYSAMKGWVFQVSALTFVVPELYDLYDENDLRKTLFFETQKGGMTFNGTYSGSIHLFNGISNNELYLIRAECAARLEDFRNARSDINKLLKNRYLVDTFDGIEVEDSDLLAFILEERRKELVGRDIRWGDLKRLNLEPKFAKTLVREINGQKFTLPPNDPRYAFPFPSSENNDKMKR